MNSAFDFVLFCIGVYALVKGYVDREVFYMLTGTFISWTATLEQ